MRKEVIKIKCSYGINGQEVAERTVFMRSIEKGVSVSTVSVI